MVFEFGGFRFSYESGVQRFAVGLMSITQNSWNSVNSDSGHGAQANDGLHAFDNAVLRLKKAMEDGDVGEQGFFGGDRMTDVDELGTLGEQTGALSELSSYFDRNNGSFRKFETANGARDAFSEQYGDRLQDYLYNQWGDEPGANGPGDERLSRSDLLAVQDDFQFMEDAQEIYGENDYDHLMPKKSVRNAVDSLVENWDAWGLEDTVSLDDLNNRAEIAQAAETVVAARDGTAYGQDSDRARFSRLDNAVTGESTGGDAANDGHISLTDFQIYGRTIVSPDTPDFDDASQTIAQALQDGAIGDDGKVSLESLRTLRDDLQQREDIANAYWTVLEKHKHDPADVAAARETIANVSEAGVSDDEFADLRHNGIGTQAGLRQALDVFLSDGNADRRNQVDVAGPANLLPEPDEAHRDPEHPRMGPWRERPDDVYSIADFDAFATAV